MAGEKLHTFIGKIGIRDPGHADLSGFARSAALKEKTAGILEQIGNRATAIGQARRTEDALMDVNQYTFDRDENGEVIAPELKPMGALGFTAYEKKYNEAMGLRIKYEFTSDAEQAAVQARAEHPNDPAKFQEAYQVYADRAIQGAPDRIRGEISEIIDRAGEGHYKSMVLRKGVEDFKIADEASQHALNKNLRDMTMAIKNEADFMSPQMADLMDKRMELLTERLATFQPGADDPDVRQAFFELQAREMNAAMIDAFGTRQILFDENGNQRVYNEGGYSAALSYISSIRSGAIDVPSYEITDDGALPTMRKLSDIMSDDEREKIAKRMTAIAKTGRAIYGGQASAIQTSIQNEYTAGIVSLMESGINAKEAAETIGSNLRIRYAHVADSMIEVDTFINELQVRLTRAGRTEHGEAVSTMLNDIISDEYDKTSEQLEQATGVDLDQLSKGDPELFVRVTNFYRSEMNRAAASRNAQNKIGTTLERNLFQYGSWLQSTGSVRDSLANMHTSPTVTKFDKKASDNDRVRIQRVVQGELSDDEWNRLSPAQQVVRSRAAFAMHILPRNIANELSAIGSIESNPGEAWIDRAASLYREVQNQIGGKEALRNQFGGKVRALEMASVMSYQKDYSPARRAMVAEAWNSNKKFDFSSIISDPSKRQDLINEFNEMVGDLDRPVGGIMKSRIQDAFMLMLPNVDEGDIEGAFDAAMKYVQSGAGAYRVAPKFLGNEMSGGYVSDPNLNWYTSRGVGEYFQGGSVDVDLLKAIKASGVTLPSGRVPNTTMDLGLGSGVFIKTAKSKDPNLFYVYERYETTDGIKTRMMRGADDRPYVFDIEKPMARYIRGQYKAGAGVTGERIPADNRFNEYDALQKQIVLGVN